MDAVFELPNKKEIENRYASYGPVFTEILANIESKLKNTIVLSTKPTYKTRIKSFSSYYKKILRQKAQEASTSKKLVTLTDMIGIRVVCAFLEDLGTVQQQIESAFNVKEIEVKGENQSFREFGYESVHVLVSIPEDCFPKNNHGLSIPESFVCEIQIRTILQDAWAEVEHELIYKSEFNPFDLPLRRKLASINASLSLADTIFQEIRDYQNKLQLELGTRRDTFYKKADYLTESEHDLNLPKVNASQLNSPFEKGSIDDLVLEALHFHNAGNYSKAIEIYGKILNSKPVPSPVVLGVIYKHRGMAYFAQNEYDNALEDFKNSIKNDPKSFRSLYYEGIVYSIQNKNKDAVESFTNSLAIDSFQSHVYYRRALAYYNLGEYSLSMTDVNNAYNLGLEDDDLNSLKIKLMKKFDMQM